jgi:hypothetical protein
MTMKEATLLVAIVAAMLAEGSYGQNNVEMCSFCPHGITAGVDYVLQTGSTAGEELTCGGFVRVASMYSADDVMCTPVKIVENVCCPGMTMTAPLTDENFTTSSVNTDLLSVSVRSNPGDVVDGYDFVAEGGCTDAAGEPYMQIMQVYTSGHDLCAQYCDNFRNIDAADGKLRGFWWNDATNIGQPSDKHCYCQFDAGSNIDKISKEYGASSNEIRLEGLGNQGTGTICSGIVSDYNAWCYRISEDSVDSASSCDPDATAVTVDSTPNPPAAADWGAGDWDVLGKSGKESGSIKPSTSGKSSKSSWNSWSMNTNVEGKASKSGTHNVALSNLQKMKYQDLNGAVEQHGVHFFFTASSSLLAALTAWYFM